VKGKGNKERVVPFGSQVRRTLRRYVMHFRPEPDSPRTGEVFLTEDGFPLKPRAVQSMLLLADFPSLFQYPKPGKGGGVNPELDAIMTGMPMAFNPKAAEGLDVTIQYVLSGEGGGLYYAHIRGGKCTAHHGVVDKPALTIHAPANVWLAISKGELDGSQAFMQGMYRVTGDMSILLKMDDLFTAGSRPSDNSTT